MELNDVVTIVMALSIPGAFLHGWVTGRSEGVIVGATLAFDTILEHGIEQEEKGTYLVKLVDDLE